MPPTLAPAKRSESALRPPPAALSACVRAYYWHDVPSGPNEGVLPLAHRLSWIPPNPYVSLVWLVSGHALLVEAAGRPGAWPLPTVFVAGPTRQGWRSVASPAYVSFGVVFQPAAWALLTGARTLPSGDLPQDALQHLPADPWGTWLREVAAAPDHGARMAMCSSFLAERWAAQRPAASVWTRLSERAWTAPAQAAALKFLGWSQRHFQRRTRAVTGLSAGEVSRLLRLEQALRDLRDGRACRAELAAEHGYADQPHFTREVRRHYGRTPGELLRDAADGERCEDWLLRL